MQTQHGEREGKITINNNNNIQKNYCFCHYVIINFLLFLNVLFSLPQK